MTSGHYFDATPGSPSEPATVELVLPELTLELLVDRGTFSHGRIDPGTAYLITAGPPPPPEAGTLLDLGCGYGPIAMALAVRAPDATVWAVDVNERARDLCARNAERLGLTNVRVAPPDDVPPTVAFDAVFSNPPIRIGKVALRDLLRTWLARLDADGHATLVVHRHLGADSLARWLVTEGWTCTRLGSRRGYRLLDVTSGRAS